MTTQHFHTQLGLAVAYGAASALLMLIRRAEGTRALALWTVAFFLFSLDAAISAAIQWFQLPVALQSLAWLALAGGTISALVGLLSFFNLRLSKGVYALAGTVVGAVGLGLVAGVRVEAVRVVVFWAIGVSLAWAGILAFRSGVQEGAGRWVASSAFLGAAVYALVWPLVAPGGLDRLEFYLDLSLMMWGTLGVLLLHFDRARAQIRRMATQELALREQLARVERTEALGRLAAGVAHDFNNVLTVVINGSEVVLRQLEDRPRVAAQLRVVLDAAQGAVGLTRQLLALGRRHLPGRTPTYVSDAVAAALRMVRPSLPANVHAVFHVEPSEAWVLAAEGQVEQLIVNLTLNAADAMPDGGNIEIRAGCPSTASDLVQLTVQDQGVGMDAATQTRIFDPFFTTKDPNRGTGLGLATVHAIVTQLGGSITVDSQPGAGSTFTIDLPRCEPELDPASRKGTADPSTMDLLVVDDQPAVAESITQGLRGLGFRARALHDPLEALKQALAHPPDVLISDVNMPALQGPELARRLRERWPTLPVVLITGNAPDSQPTSQIERTAWLAKPFAIEALRRAIEDTLGSSAAR